MKKKRNDNSTTDIDLQNRVAIAVRSLRVSAGLSQQDLADRIGLTQAAISQTERKSSAERQGRMNLTTLKKIADALDQPLWELIQRAETCDVTKAVGNLERGVRKLA